MTTPKYPIDKPWTSTHYNDTAFKIAKIVFDEFDKGVGPKLHENMLATAEKAATYDHAKFLQDIRDGKCSTYKNHRKETVSHEYRKQPTYTTRDRTGETGVLLGQTVQRQRQWLLEARYSVDIKRAQIDAAQNFNLGRHKFFIKIDHKLGSVFNGSKAPVKEVKISLGHSLPVEGTLNIQVDDETQFEIRLKIKHNWRGSTSYWQYPATFHNATVGGEHVYASLNDIALALGKTYGWPARDTQDAPASVEATKENLKSLVSLWLLLADEKKLTEDAADRRRHRYMVGTQGPRAQISRNTTKLGLPKGIKTNAVRKILDSTMPKALKDRLFVVMAAGKVKRAKRGSGEAAADKMLKHLELIQSADIGQFGEGYGNELSRTGRRLMQEVTHGS